MDNRTFTVVELVNELLKMKPHARVCLVDVDTQWTISEFSLREESKPQADLVWIEPCEYSDMNKEFG